MGKGSAPRKQRDDAAYAKNWELIFRKQPAESQPAEVNAGTPVNWPKVYPEEGSGCCGKCSGEKSCK